jgi:hypothetical protein
MATESISARELAALVKPVRALLTKKNKEAAVMLVTERTKCGLEESKEFVEHVESRPAARAQDVAEGVTLGEAAADEMESEPQLAARSIAQSVEAREAVDAKDMSLAEWYARFMQRTTTSSWRSAGAGTLLEKNGGAEARTFGTSYDNGTKIPAGSDKSRLVRRPGALLWPTRLRDSRAENLKLVMQTMGQKDVKTAMKYQHPELDIVRTALNETAPGTPQAGS